MNNNIIFKSSFSNVFNEYLRIRLNQGVKINHELTLMKELDQIIVKKRKPVDRITRELIEEWKELQSNESDRTKYGKSCQMIRFCTYLCQIGIDSFIMPKPKRPSNFFVPRIFSKEEIAKIFKIADTTTLTKPMFNSCLISIPVLIRFLYYAGCRVGETISINNEDVDMIKGMVLLRNTKNKKNRLIPLNDNMKSIFSQYLWNRARLKAGNLDLPSAPFFVKADGTRISTNAAYKRFKEILEKCGISDIGHNQGSRLHDLRHTFAVHSLQHMVESGLDIYTALPILSVLLGHSSVYATENYVRLTIKLFPDIIYRNGDTIKKIFPNIEIP